VNLSSNAALYGINAARVIAAIKRRQANREAGQTKPDGRKLALVLEGGAMRAAGPAGGVVALGHLGLAEVFDEVYATSAGVMNAGYFLSGQADMGITIYFEDLTTGRFINPFRFWKIVDVDYLIDEVAAIKKPLDVQRILNSPTRLYATVMNERGQPSLIDTKLTKTPFLTILKAALAMPVLYNRTVEVEGKNCMDAGLRVPFPLQQAIENGCTDILLLLSRSHEYVPARHFWLGRLFFDLICARGRRGLSQVYAMHHLYSGAVRDLALGRSASAPPHVNMAVICTERSEPIHRTTVDPLALRAAAVSYGRRTLRAFGVEEKEWNLGPASSVGFGGDKRTIASAIQKGGDSSHGDRFPDELLKRR
jgi:predicted patatin/cPLA2 family phospholipase